MSVTAVTNKSGVTIEVASKWEMVRFAGGSTIAPFKVMGFVGDWVMIRRKHASPICVHINQFGTEYVQK